MNVEKLKQVRSDLTERRQFMDKLGGEWNAGYSAGIQYAMELVYVLVRELEGDEKNSTLPKEQKWALLKDDWNKKPGCGKDCRCKEA